ncbi:hypothetical protein HGRIS_005015 [Hohenbuehelia grisea]|uniref:Peptide hydrolase n=1 Tax=Hohenbuehelia grisea TaxID=104357 RepID=A0ABR3JEJ2_9AGAR
MQGRTVDPPSLSSSWLSVGLVAYGIHNMKFNLSLNLVLAALAFVQAAPIRPEEIHSKAAKGLRLLTLAEDAEPVWKTEDQKLDLMRQGVKFIDVTETYEIEQAIPKSAAKAPAATFPAPSHQTAVKALTATISLANMQSNLATLSNFNNRYYKSSTGADGSNWILSTVQGIASGHAGVTVAAFKHSWVQSSIIAKIPGKSASSPVTIIGAHLDSINLSSPTSGRAPGSDDDGSGTVNLIEAFRVLLASGFQPSTPVEFHWYSGEEGGLLGSNAIATSYSNAGVKVKAFMELDMTAFFKPGSTEVVALEADYVDSGLNTFVKSLVTTYTRLPVTMDSPCGYACSDHASWYKFGVPTTMPFEAVTGNDNSRIHSTADTTTLSGFSWSHSLEFAKIAVAFIYELAI